MKEGFTVGFGTIIAMIASWSINHSVLYALIHGILGWIYVIYYVIIYVGVDFILQTSGAQ